VFGSLPHTVLDIGTETEPPEWCQLANEALKRGPTPAGETFPLKCDEAPFFGSSRFSGNAPFG